METKNIHQSIAKTEDGPATTNQVNYLISLYEEMLTTAIDGSKRPEYKRLKKFNNFMLFKNKYQDNVKGILGVHLWSTYIPANKNMTKHTLSNMINSAYNEKKFDKKFITSFLKSANSYKKA